MERNMAPLDAPARDEERQRQIRQAEELLFSTPTPRSFVKDLFRGRCIADCVMPYPTVADAERPKLDAVIRELVAFCDAQLDPEAIDRQADIPRTVIDGLARLGVLGMTAPEAIGGKGFSQLAYGRVLEELGRRCSSTSIFVNAHHSIGMRALLLFGSDEQKRRWLPDLVHGRKLAAFALTEPEAGSDAANVQTRATPSDDGDAYLLNGEKRYITNGAIADVLTVMARTPVPGNSETAITAFLVTPDTPGFRVVEARMPKLGIRGTATARLAFENMRVSKANVLGPLGKGLKVALTVLDFGRTTFGACCTGTAKTCLQLAIEHASTRRQFGQTLGEFELIQKKLARMAAWTYAMESMTTVTAGLIDRTRDDYMLETAILKVYSTEALWTIVNDAFQIYGGAAYFADKPLERMLRDARINQIGEGANEVLTSFIALVGIRPVAEELRKVRDALQHPWNERATIVRFLQSQVSMRLGPGVVPTRNGSLAAQSRRFARLVRRFAAKVVRLLIRHREQILERQLVQERIADAAGALYAYACVLSRLDAESQTDAADHMRATSDHASALLALEMSAAQIHAFLQSHEASLDAPMVATAVRLLARRQ